MKLLTEHQLEDEEKIRGREEKKRGRAVIWVGSDLARLEHNQIKERSIDPC